jgi:hypothetical protein
MLRKELLASSRTCCLGHGKSQSEREREERRGDRRRPSPPVNAAAVLLKPPIPCIQFTALFSPANALRKYAGTGVGSVDVKYGQGHTSA